MITLRTATREDIPILADVLARVQAQSDPTIDVDHQRDAMVQAINGYFGTDEPESLLSIIEVDGVPAGRFRVVRLPDRIFLGGIQVHPDFQGKGVGTELINALIEEGRALSKPVVLDVDRDNNRARALYERLGFEQESETDKDFRMIARPE